MRRDAFIKLFIIVLLGISTLLTPENEISSVRFFKILRGEQTIGRGEERLKSVKEQILYEKKVEYIKGERFYFIFSFDRNFKNIRGKIIKDGEKIFEMSKAMGNKKVERSVLPSSLINLYVHKLLKERKEIPEKCMILYENTGEIIPLSIKMDNRNGYVEVVYILDKINLQIVELFFPHKNAYCMFSGEICFIDESLLDNELLPKLIRKENSKIKELSIPQNFTGFSDCSFILYKLSFDRNFSLPEDERQNIIEVKDNGRSKVFLLSVNNNPIRKVGKNEYYKSYNNYIETFYNSHKIKNLTSKITRGSKDTQQKIHRIIEWIKGNIQPVKDGPLEPLFVLKHKKGDCQGISNLFLEMCSSLNIPARAVVGLIIHKQNGKYFYSFHQWVELLEGSYWIPYDPTFGTRGVGLNYIKLIEVEKKIDFLKLLNALNINLEIMEVK